MGGGLPKLAQRSPVLIVIPARVRKPKDKAAAEDAHSCDRALAFSRNSLR